MYAFVQKNKTGWAMKKKVSLIFIELFNNSEIFVKIEGSFQFN